MRGGSLTRYRPDDVSQEGEGFLRDIVTQSLGGAADGFKTGRNLRDRISQAKRGAKHGAKRAVKRKAEEVIARNIKRKLKDIFGP